MIDTIRIWWMIFSWKTALGIIAKIYAGFLKSLLAYIAFIGIFGFSLFICEEGSQVIMWSNFSALDANRYDLVKINYEAIEKTNETFDLINKYFMWCNPFQQWGYEAYSVAMTNYTNTMKAMCIARAPSLYIGDKVTIRFKYTRAITLESGKFKLINSRLSVITTQMPAKNPAQYTGIMTAGDNNKHIVITDPLQP